MDEFAADEIIAKLDRMAERRIQEAVEAGVFDNLEGMGKPLNIEDNPFVPKEMRAAFKVLENAGYAPDWMNLAQEIENELDRIRTAADRHFSYLRASLAEISSSPFAAQRLGSHVARLKAQHKRAAAQHSRDITELNRKIGMFNQMVPIASLNRVTLSLEAEMEKYEARVPAFLTYMETG